MKKTPRLSDHAGHAQDRGVARSTQRTADKVDSFECVNCGTRRYVTPLEWTRAAKPHCLKCGGALTDTQATVKKNGGGKLARRQAEKKMDAVLADVRNSLKCWSCGHRAADGFQLGQHLKTNSACLVDYRGDGKMAKGYVMGTGHIEMRRANKWILTAFSITTKDMVEIGAYSTMFNAREALEKLNITPDF